MMKVLELGAHTGLPGFGLDLNVKHASALQQTDRPGWLGRQISKLRVYAVYD